MLYIQVIAVISYYNFQFFLSVFMFVYVLFPPRYLGLSSLNFQGVMVATVGWFVVSLVKIGLKLHS